MLAVSEGSSKALNAALARTTRLPPPNPVVVGKVLSVPHNYDDYSDSVYVDSPYDDYQDGGESE